MSAYESSDDAMDLETDQDASTAIVPEHLGNEDTMIKLGFIDELKKLFAINELLNLPQVCMSCLPWCIFHPRVLTPELL